MIFFAVLRYVKGGSFKSFWSCSSFNGVTNFYFISSSSSYSGAFMIN